MISKECKHKHTGIIGKITKELKRTDNFPDQWGVCWYNGIQLQKTGYYFWNDKNLIEIMENKN